MTPEAYPQHSTPDHLVNEVSKRLAFNQAAYGKTWTGEDEDTRFLVQPLLDEIERLRDRLATMNECVRTYLQMRDAGTPARPGWLEEEVAATAAALGTDERQKHDGGCLLRGAEGRVGIFVCTCGMRPTGHAGEEQ